MGLKAFKVVGVLVSSLYLPIVLTPSANAEQKRSCQPYATVLSSAEPSVPAGKVFCKDDDFTLARPIMVACIKTYSRIVIVKPEDLGRCDSASANARRCISSNPIVCSKMNRGDEFKNSALVKPYGKVIIETRPVLELKSVKNATSYEIHLWGHGTDWRIKTQDRIINWPKAQPSLQFGHVYQLAVRAYLKEKQISTQYGQLKLIPKVDFEKTTKALVTANKISDLEKRISTVFDLLNDYDLIDESIKTLSKVEELNKSVFINRLLGYAYESVGLKDSALNQYQKALFLSMQFNDIYEQNAVKQAIFQLRLTN